MDNQTPTDLLVKKLGRDQCNDVVEWLKVSLLQSRVTTQSANDLYDIVRGQGASRSLEVLIRNIESAVNAPKKAK